MSITGLVFLVVFFIFCIFAIVRHPIYGLLAYVGEFFLHPPSRWWGQGVLLDFRWSMIGSLVTLLAIFIHRKKLTAIPSIFKNRIAVVYCFFVLWIFVESSWALDFRAHWDFFLYYLKFGLTLFMFYKCLDSERHLNWFLWVHVLGCFYFGWIAFTGYEGGRFEGFGGPGLSEANAGALAIVTGVLAASSLFLYGGRVQKLLLLGLLPVIVNGLVTTISRSGFISAIFGGYVFNYFTPKRFTGHVRVFSVLAVVLFGMLTGPVYWQRINSINQMGKEIEGVDTGAGRLVILDSQIRMFFDHPFGCGATCTAILSSAYMPDKYLTGEGENRARASHNTYLTMLVEHGLPGLIFYLLIIMFIISDLNAIRNCLKYYPNGNGNGFTFCVLPAIASMLAAIYVCDLFASYAKFEIRIWLLGALMALVNVVRINTADNVFLNEK